jgi:hypothetical protein
MNNSPKPNSRRKFIALGVVAAGVLSAFKFLRPASAVAEKKQTVKMLSQEGKLVEVDVAALKGAKKKVTNNELQNWIKK